MFSIIVAVSKNNMIGKDNSIPWFIPEDLKRFKEITMGKKMIMGRKTFESLPGVLPGRKHIILTRNKDYKVDNENVEVYYDFDDLINKFKDSEEEVFIIGGSEIYNKFYKHANKLFLTEVDLEVDGDTTFPIIDLNEWNLVNSSSKNISKSKSNIPYIYKDFTRKL